MKKTNKNAVDKINMAKDLFMIVMRPTFFVAKCVVAIGACVGIMSLN